MRVFIWLLPIGILLYIWRFPRAESRCAVLRLLATSIDSGISPGGLLSSLGREAGFREREKLTRLAETFDAGSSVSQSIDAMGTYFPAEVQTELRVAEACGVLPQTITRVADEWQSRQDRFSTEWDRLCMYLAMVSMVIWGIIAFLGVYIVPKFKAIADDLGLAFGNNQESVIQGLPVGSGGAGLGGLQIATIDGISRIWGWIDFCALIVASLVVLALMPMFFRFLTGHRLGSVWGKIASRFWPQRDTSLLLRVLRVPIEAGRPLNAGLSELEVHHPYSYMRGKIQKINESVERGESCWDVMREMKLLNAQELGLIHSAETRGHLPWVLTEMANSIENRQRDRLQLLGTLMQPVAVFVVAIPVLGIAWGVISFLLSMMRIL